MRLWSQLGLPIWSLSVGYGYPYPGNMHSRIIIPLPGYPGYMHIG